MDTVSKLFEDQKQFLREPQASVRVATNAAKRFQCRYATFYAREGGMGGGIVNCVNQNRLCDIECPTPVSHNIMVNSV